jgi:hypothetical protein
VDTMQGKVSRIGLAFVQELLGDRHRAHYALILEGAGRVQFRLEEREAERFGTALALTQPGDYVYLTLKSDKNGAQCLDSFRNSQVDNVNLAILNS